MATKLQGYWVAGSLGLGLLALLTLAKLRPAPEPEPCYAGNPLTYYLENQTYGDLRKEREAVEAIRSIGSNAVPHLIRILNQRESRLRKQCFALFAPRAKVGGGGWTLTARQRHAALACQALGPMAAPAIPALTRLVNDPELAGHAVKALAYAGPQSFPVLTNALHAGILEARIEAAGNLRCFGPRADSVRALLQALEDPHPTVRARAADTLGVMRGYAALAAPALIEALADVHPEVRHSASRSLGWLGEEPTTAASATHEPATRSRGR